MADGTGSAVARVGGEAILMDCGATLGSSVSGSEEGNNPKAGNVAVTGASADSAATAEAIADAIGLNSSGRAGAKAGEFNNGCRRSVLPCPDVGDTADEGVESTGVGTDRAGKIAGNTGASNVVAPEDVDGPCKMGWEVTAELAEGKASADAGAPRIGNVCPRAGNSGRSPDTVGTSSPTDDCNEAAAGRMEMEETGVTTVDATCAIDALGMGSVWIFKLEGDAAGLKRATVTGANRGARRFGNACAAGVVEDEVAAVVLVNTSEMGVLEETTGKSVDEGCRSAEGLPTAGAEGVTSTAEAPDELGVKAGTSVDEGCIATEEVRVTADEPPLSVAEDVPNDTEAKDDRTPKFEFENSVIWLVPPQLWSLSPVQDERQPPSIAPVGNANALPQRQVFPPVIPAYWKLLQ
ncbi:hypothetical protein SVAN01_11780 [Stagonosporopsis vannaccii]|nr:hypothetical protein SVAN01_11780 [Stagonosporopsis vannaccii]